MDKESIIYAKAAATKKSFESLISGAGYGNAVFSKYVTPLLPIYLQIGKDIKALVPDLFSDLPEFTSPIAEGGIDEPLYLIGDIELMIKNLDYIIEVRAQYRIGERIEEKEKRIFISHGASKEWFRVQAYIEKNLKIETLELAQQPNIGRTVIQKLYEESAKCNSSIIVMTGDDKFTNGEIRARENVLHEIGFFQGRLGLGNVILLHEEGVSIPSNIHGLVYISFPKDTIEATFGAITTELKIIMN